MFTPSPGYLSSQLFKLYAERDVYACALGLPINDRNGNGVMIDAYIQSQIDEVDARIAALEAEIESYAA